MAIDLASDTKLDSQPDQSTDLASFKEVIDGVGSVEESTEDAPDEEVVEEPDKPETYKAKEAEEVAEEPVPEPAPAVEGPSIAAKMAAEQSGLPAPLIELATSDEQLSQFVALAQQTSGPVEEEPAVAALEIDLPLDEYPENDPVRKELTKIQSHFSQQLNQMREQLKETSSKTSGFELQQAETAKQQAMQTQSEFDSALDSMGAKAFGNTKDLSSANIHLRTAAFNLVQELKNANPGQSVADLARTAAEQLDISPNLKTPAERAAIRKQSKKRLGSGPSQPASPGHQSDTELMRDFLISAGLK